MNLYNLVISKVALHFVGNQCKKESVRFSKDYLTMDDEQASLLTEFFLKTFRKKELDNYLFNTEDVQRNPIYHSAESIFKNEADLLVHSKMIAEWLYDNSNSPHIKSGELFVVSFKDSSEKATGRQVLGIFKCETINNFIKAEQSLEHKSLVLDEGIGLEKLDKGCLIIKESGSYTILTVDSNNYDTKYWNDNFLGIESASDAKSLTKNYLKFCNDFSKNIIEKQGDKHDSSRFLNNAMHHFAKNDDFNEQNFLNEVVQDPMLIDSFRNYKDSKSEKYRIEDLSDFSIDNSSVSVMRGKIKNSIELDTNVTIKINALTPDQIESIVEKGWDEERQMYYYLVYFNKEK